MILENTGSLVSIFFFIFQMGQPENLPADLLLKHLIVVLLIVLRAVGLYMETQRLN